MGPLGTAGERGSKRRAAGAAGAGENLPDHMTNTVSYLGLAGTFATVQTTYSTDYFLEILVSRWCVFFTINVRLILLVRCAPVGRYGGPRRGRGSIPV